MRSASHTAARIPSLDGIRAVAIGMVILAHLSGGPGFLELPAGSADVVGNTGVRIFFVLSGFLITSILLAEVKEYGRVSLIRFYIRRCFRIFPAFYLFLAALAIASAAGWILLKPGDLLKSAIYVVDYCPWDSTSNFVRHIWSLSVEEQFYLIWPIAVWAVGPRSSQWIAVGSILLSPLWRLAILHIPGADLTVYRRFDCLSDVLATGCLLACLHSSLLNSQRYLRALRSPFVHMLPVLVLGAAATGDHPLVYFGLADTVMNVGIALYLHRCILFPPKWLNGGGIRQIGRMSYSLYLWQQPFCAHQDGLTEFPWFAGLALTLVASSISYFGVEVPLQKLGRRFTRSSSPSELAAGPAPATG